MDELQIEIEMKAAFAPFLEKGFTYQYTYEKGGDSSCVYIYRFQKGSEFMDTGDSSTNAGGRSTSFCYDEFIILNSPHGIGV